MTARRPATLGALAIAVVAGGLLAGCGGNGSSVSCTGNDCRAPRDNDGVDFTVNGLAPGSADIEDVGVVTRIPQGGTFVEDGSTVRLESSDGRTAVFTFRKR